MSISDAPDGQNAVVNAQVLLASVPAATLTAIVTLPANTTTLAVFVANILAAGINPICDGVTTGVGYPGVLRPVGPGGAGGGVWFFTVSPANDAQVEILWGVTPGVTWSIVAMSGVNTVDVPSLTNAIAKVNSSIPTNAVLIGGTNAGAIAPLLVDSGGRLVPLVPTIGNTIVLTGGADTLAAAPSVLAWYLFGVDLIIHTGAAGLAQVSVGGVGIADLQVGTTVNLSDHVDLKGFRATGAVTIQGNANMAAALRYAPGP